MHILYNSAAPFKLRKFQKVESKLSQPENLTKRPSTAGTRRPEAEKENLKEFNQPSMFPSMKDEPKHKNYGKTPMYITKYKDEMQAEKEKKMEERAKAKMPKGTRLMTEDERIETLEQLQQKKTELQSMIEKMPISMRTDALKIKKRELEEKMKEVERAITTFSRKIVYVAE